jgi:hypothetical protein
MNVLNLPRKTAPKSQGRKFAVRGLPARDKQTRLFASPMITKGEGKIGYISLGFVRRIKVSLISITKLFNRLRIPAIESDPPWRLLQKTIRNTGVILNHVVGTRKDHRAGFLELAIVQ